MGWDSGRKTGILREGSVVSKQLWVFSAVIGLPFADPYVKLYLRKENGERIVKKKTHVRRATVNPVYNESFVFELPETKMDNAVIDLQVGPLDRF